jgi:hypothetical protein
VEGPSSLQSGGDWIFGTCGRSYCCLVVRVAHIEVARCTQCTLLRERGRGRSRSRDLFDMSHYHRQKPLKLEEDGVCVAVAVVVVKAQIEAEERYVISLL